MLSLRLMFHVSCGMLFDVRQILCSTPVTSMRCMRVILTVVRSSPKGSSALQTLPAAPRSLP